MLSFETKTAIMVINMMMVVMFIIIFNIMKILLRLEEVPTELRSCQHLLRGMRSRKGATCQ